MKHKNHVTIEDLKKIDNPPSTVSAEIEMLEAEIKADNAYATFRKYERIFNSKKYAYQNELIQVGIGMQLGQGEMILEELKKST